MFAVCLLVLLGIWIIPKIRESKGNAAWEKTSTEEKWKFYLDALRKMNWDTFQFGSYNLKDWHYDEVIGFLDRLESGVFPVDDWEITKVDGEIKHTGKITFDLSDVENYILNCHEMYIDPTLEKLFDKDCREDFRNGFPEQHKKYAERDNCMDIDTEAILSAFRLACVQKDGKYVNGFRDWKEHK